MTRQTFHVTHTQINVTFPLLEALCCHLWMKLHQSQMLLMSRLQLQEVRKEKRKIFLLGSYFCITHCRSEPCIVETFTPTCCCFRAGRLRCFSVSRCCSGTLPEMMLPLCLSDIFRKFTSDAAARPFLR